MNHSETVWIYLLVYFSARLFFMDTKLLLGKRKPKAAFPFKRIIWGITILLLVPRLERALLLIALHSLAVSLEYVIFRTVRISTRAQYTGQLTVALTVWPVIITMLNSLLPLTANPIHTVFLSYIQAMTYFNPILQLDMADKLPAIAAGFIFTLKEATIIIRFGLQGIQAVPSDKKHPGKQDEKEYERGRFIGNLERSLIYFLILFNQIGAIAIVIALKSLARFKDMEDKDFAEYFLIGSFLSIIMAVIPAVLVMYL